MPCKYFNALNIHSISELLVGLGCFAVGFKSVGETLQTSTFSGR